MRVSVQFAACANIEQTARRVVRAGCKRIAIGEEAACSGQICRTQGKNTYYVRDSINIGLVPGKSLCCLAATDIPKLGRCIASA